MMLQTSKVCFDGTVGELFEGKQVNDIPFEQLVEDLLGYRKWTSYLGGDRADN